MIQTRSELSSMQKMTRATLRLLLLIMLYQDVVLPMTLTCLPNDSCHCRNTSYTFGHQWRIFCSLPEKINLTVILEYNIQTATVYCYDMDTWPVVEIEMFKLAGLMSEVKFDHCPLPEWSLSNMIGNGENETMNMLELSGLTSTMSKLTRRNFLRLPKFDELMLFSSGVVEFSADALQDLSDLQSIYFSKNEISVLPGGIFKGLTKLETLSLNDNKMQRVNSLLFENLSILESLSLSDNRLESLDSGTFKDLVSLRDLNIVNNYLTTLPENIFQPLEKLQHLQMGGNEFFSLPHRLLMGNSRLLTVELSENRGNLSTLPNEFFGHLPSLSNVYLRGNNLTVLPEDTFVGSPRVGAVDLSRNKFNKLQERIFKDLTSISMINLSDNELNNLPVGLLHGLKRLASLYLQNNAITSISRNLFSNSIRWEYVNFDFNQISEIESWSFSNRPTLSHVRLRKNELTNLPENIFWGSFSLFQLDISENKLTDLPVKLFRDSMNLWELNLNANNLKNLPEGIFQGLDRLSYLNVENNSFTTLPAKVLAQATSLQDLRFQFNRMTEINLGHLVCLPSIRVACFSHNLITRIIPRTNSQPELLRCTKIPRLTDLALDHNNITNFLWHEMDIFRELNLLNLTYNRISSVELLSYGLMQKPVTIDVTRNNISKLVSIDNIPLDARVRLYIGDNPIDCGCDLYQLRKYSVDKLRFEFNKMYVIASEYLTCGQPVSMLERRVENFEMETSDCKLHDGDKPRICRAECYCTWRASDDTLVVICSYRNLTRAPYDFEGFEGSAIELNLAGNSITEMSFFHEHSWREYKYEKVRKIILSRNKIRNVTFDVVPGNLSVLHLDNNHLTRFHVAVAETVRNTTSLQELALHSNPWSCDGETREAFNILKEKLDRKIGDAFGKSCLDSRYNKNGDEKPKSYITYQMF